MSASTSGRGPKRPRSVVWYYFEKVPNERYIARCKLCGSQCHHANNTSNLFKHLRVKHPANYREAEEQREQEMDLYIQLKAKAGKPITAALRPLKPPPTPSPRGRGRPSKNSTNHIGNKSPSSAKIDLNDSASVSPAADGGVKKQSYYFNKILNKQELEKAFIAMLAHDMEHPSIVNRPGFRNFISALNSKFEIPTKKSINKTIIPNITELTKSKIKLDVLLSSYISLSVENWLYRETQSFMTVSAHFVMESWDMCSIVLESFDCSEEKTETSIANNLKRITDEWGITDRVVTLVSDCVDEVLSSASLVNGWDELTCFGHIMNQIVLNSIAAVPDIVRIQKKAQEAVNYFDLHTKATDTLSAVQLQHSLPVHRLKSEEPRYWTSILAMFERIVEQYEAVNTVLCFLNHDLMCLCDDEVEVIRGVILVLKPFEAATNELCAEPYTCMSKMIPIASLLQKVIAACPVPDDQMALSALRDSLTAQLQQHLSCVESNYKLAAATLLDPRFKQHAFTDVAALEDAQQKLLSDVQLFAQTSDSVSNGVGAPSGTDTGSFWGLFDKKVVDAGAMKTDITEAENETQRFFKEANIPRMADPFHWWKLNEVQFPNLKVLAKKFLCVPATAVDSSRLFSKHGDEFTRRRNLFRPGQLNNMLFLNKNLNI